jgi:hypothetical protein
MQETKNQAPATPPLGRDENDLSRKPYQKPDLIEWGSLADLTRGLASGFQDLPAGGGSEAE